MEADNVIESFCYWLVIIFLDRLILWKGFWKICHGYKLSFLGDSNLCSLVLLDNLSHLRWVRKQKQQILSNHASLSRKYDMPNLGISMYFVGNVTLCDGNGTYTYRLCSTTEPNPLETSKKKFIIHFYVLVNNLLKIRTHHCAALKSLWAGSRWRTSVRGVSVCEIERQSHKMRKWLCSDLCEFFISIPETAEKNKSINFHLKYELWQPRFLWKIANLVKRSFS